MAKRKPKPKPDPKNVIIRGFSCPNCGGGRVPKLYTRHRPASGRVVRVRRCSDCGHRFRTAEYIESNNSPGRDPLKT